MRTANDDQKTGVDIVRKALQAPARQIATNAGEDGSVIVGKILENSNYGFGFDAQARRICRHGEEGHHRPNQGRAPGMQGASSVGGLLITTEAMVAELPKKQNSMPPMPGGGGGMDF